MTSPTQRSKALLQEQGYHVAIVERWCSFTRRRHDLFGFADLLAIREGETPLLVQVTSTGVSSRVRKILESDLAPLTLKSGFRIQVHGWRKLKVKRGGKAMRWSPRIVHITEADFNER